MTTLITVLAVLAIQAAIAGAGYAGYRIGRRSIPKPPPVDETESQRQAKINKAFQAVMAYDVNTALRRPHA